MQTKKRAKPVTFGKASEVKEVEEEKVPEATDLAEAPSTAEEETPEPQAEQAQEVSSEEAPKTEESEPEQSDEPEAVSLSEKVDTEEIPSAPETSSAFSFTSEPPPTVKTPKKNRPLLLFFLIALLAFLLGLGIIAGVNYFTQQKASTPTPTPTPSIAKEQPTNTPTPKPVDLSKYTIKVLNGSGITGEAAKLKQQLVDAGFKVGATGNADNSNYTKTVISASKTVDEEYIQKLTVILKKSYTVDPGIQTLPATSSSEVIVTVGSEKAK